MNNGNTGIYDFGKWVETDVIPILAHNFQFEIVQTVGKFSHIDAMIFRGFKVYPCQIKAFAPRVIHKDISIPLSMYERYKEIAKQNGGYKVFQINTAYNPQQDLDYVVYGFDILDMPVQISSFSQYNSSKHVYFKYSDMRKFDCLPLDFQKRMEQMKYKLNPPSEKYSHLYYKKFDG